ncbi:hypothetical protein OAE63_00905, partial [bacterium]|nr:hypothetical protein [bacterium]
DDIPLLFDLACFGHGCWLSHHGIDLWFEWIEIENRRIRPSAVVRGIEEFIERRPAGQGLSARFSMKTAPDWRSKPIFLPEWPGGLSLGWFCPILETRSVSLVRSD